MTGQTKNAAWQFAKNLPFHTHHRETTILTPLNLQILTSGLRHFVKTYGAELRPNGRTEKQKYLTEPEKTQENPKKFDKLGKYQNGDNRT